MCQKDKKLYNVVCKVIKELICCDDFIVGIGKLELLKYNLFGFWFRCLFQKDWIVYKFDDFVIYIFVFGGYYDQL